MNVRNVPDWLYRKLWATRLKKALTALVALVVVVGVVSVVGYRVTRPDEPDHCATGVDRIDGECIGVSASAYDFGTPEISKVTAAIARENRRIESKPHVTLAMVLPLEPELAAERGELRSELQGAYLAQYRVNRLQRTPLVRLVLANPGKDYKKYDTVVDTLGTMAASRDDNLRAVTGFNLSLKESKAAIGRLTNDLHIPVVISRASADDIANPEKGEARYKGLARIIPTNQAQADALACRAGTPDKDTVLVKDTRPDIYVSSLAKAFSCREKGEPGPKDQEFESPGINRLGNTGNDFAFIGNNICQSSARTVYFAGRPVHLRLFALKLAEAGCRDKKYTIISGSGSATLERYMSDEDWQVLRGGGKEPAVTVQYAAPGHPKAWEREIARWRDARTKATGKAPTDAQLPAYLTEPRDQLRKLTDLVTSGRAGDIGPVELDDSRTMLVHDGVYTAAQAVFLANTQTGDRIPARERVAAQWTRLESAYRVAGTSGWICLTNGGNPYDKPVAIVELDPRTRKLAFVRLGWPEGRPQPDNCVVPSGTG
ncbi:amino acid ABC transporter substrate-binding protein [Streptomyces sp. NPDC050400]|uniref:amino acid ABC transporter substrate-binding protein n=1 Tax=Streptomyces sp. NPDC050400 TaxID=3365610 RepID=UPI0037B6E8EF